MYMFDNIMDTAVQVKVIEKSTIIRRSIRRQDPFVYKRILERNTGSITFKPYLGQTITIEFGIIVLLFHNENMTCELV